MSIFHGALFVIAILQAACVGSRTFTEQEQVTLAQTKTIWVDVRSDSRELPPGVALLIEKVEHRVKDKFMRAGFTVAPDWSAADVILQLAFDFSDRRRPGELSSSYDSPYQHDAHSIHIGASLDHKTVGHLLWHGESVSPPYDLNLSRSTIIRDIDSDVQQALFKSTTPAKH
ncbi:MAG: hypothetical protein OEV01_17370 [Nitrospira sp.]|nr:hypothetical protein [Nitrospira sp.]MDH4305335.1 hypothetical protein [Nitrospira sp.]